MPNTDLAAILEAVLFTASEPLSAGSLSQLTGEPEDVVTAALETLGNRLSGGIRLAHIGSTYRLVTAPEASAIVRAYLQDTSRSELTRPALETLAIIAYRGPITKSAVEDIRGVASETMIRNLLARGLIVEAGRSNEPGRPTVYAVSHAFLAHFGLTSTKELPPLPDSAHED